MRTVDKLCSDDFLVAGLFINPRNLHYILTICVGRHRYCLMCINSVCPVLASAACAGMGIAPSTLE